MPSDSTSEMWSRKVMDMATYELMQKLHWADMRVLELSGDKWRNFGFKSYKSLFYPEFDICHDILNEKFDLIIAEQVFEHLPYPARAAKTINYMLRNGGYFLNTFPFLVKYHPEPNDCTRWTETGMKYLLSECGFPLEDIESGSWGNLDCIIENAGEEWINFDESIHSLENNPRLPIHVWTLAQKQSSFPIWIRGFMLKNKNALSAKNELIRTLIKLRVSLIEKYSEKIKFVFLSPIKFVNKYYKILKNKS